MLSRLGISDFRQRWSAPEVAIIDLWFEEILVKQLRETVMVEWPVGWKLRCDISDWLTTLIIAGAEVGRLLTNWERAAEPGAALHVASLCDHLTWEGSQMRLASACLENYELQAGMIGVWASGPHHMARIERAMLQCPDARHQVILSAGYELLAGWQKSGQPA